MSGSWIRRADARTGHHCDPPTGSFDAPLGRRDDLWRCNCGQLWRIGRACNPCEYYGHGNHRGLHTVGNAWRPATLGQRLGVWIRRWCR